MGEALVDEGGPGPAAIGKYIAPRALLWFRMSAALTWLTGAIALEGAPEDSLRRSLFSRAMK